MSIRTTSEGILRLFFSEPPASGNSPAMFLDRDGVINQRILGGYVTQWSEFRFVKGIAQPLAELSELGLPVLVVSNQAGVGKGLISLEALAEISERFVAELRPQGARIDAVYYCPHTAEEHCSCRKPAAGLLKQAAHDWRIDLPRSILLGDSPSDTEAAGAVHCRAILLSLQDAQNPPHGASPLPTITPLQLEDVVPHVRRLLASK